MGGDSGSGLHHHDAPKSGAMHQRLVRELEAKRPSAGNARGLALINAALGNRDEALRWLSYDTPHAWLAWSATSGNRDLWDDSFRSDPPYRALMRRMNLRFGPGDRVPVALPVIAPPLSGAAETASPAGVATGRSPN
jgi:hypothetical protein